MSSSSSTLRLRAMDVAGDLAKAQLAGFSEAMKRVRGVHLLPQDVRRMMAATKDELRRKRIVCDFVAGMTDAYAIEFYARLKSENARTIFKPF